MQKQQLTHEQVYHTYKYIYIISLLPDYILLYLLCVFMYVGRYVCMYVCVYVWYGMVWYGMDVCMHVCM